MSHWENGAHLWVVSMDRAEAEKGMDWIRHGAPVLPPALQSNAVRDVRAISLRVDAERIRLVFQGSYCATCKGIRWDDRPCHSGEPGRMNVNWTMNTDDGVAPMIEYANQILRKWRGEDGY